MMHKLHAMMLANRGEKRGRGLHVHAEAGAGEATVYLYDVIVSSQADADWFGGVAAETFVRALNAIEAPVIHLRINSPGGDVFAGRAMQAAVSAHQSKIIAHVDGYAASAASYVALAADEVEMADGAMFMVHKAWALAVGNADELLELADLLEKIDESLIATYVKQTGIAADKIEAMMAAETWISANEAVELGFADRIAEGAAKDRIEWDVSALGGPAPRARAEPAEPKEPEGAAADRRRAEEAARAEREHYERLQQYVERIAA
jgi:ATP-dependent Clp protease protease subunit